MLQQCHLLLEVLREVGEAVLGHHILLLVCGNRFSFIVVELRATRFRHNFGGVVEEDTRRHIR